MFRKHYPFVNEVSEILWKEKLNKYNKTDFDNNEENVSKSIIAILEILKGCQFSAKSTVRVENENTKQMLSDFDLEYSKEELERMIVWTKENNIFKKKN